MKKHLLTTVAIFLLAGAVVNVGVAWGLALWLPRPPSLPFGIYREGFGPRFATNTFFWAAVLWLLIPGPFALRRLIRRRRGLCAACGYDLRHAEHEACPECGLAA